MSYKSFQTLIDRTIFAVSKEYDGGKYDGVLLVLKKGTLAMVATEGHRLSSAEMPNDFTGRFGEEKRMHIVHKVLLEIMQLLSVSQTHKVEFAENEGAYSCRIGDQILSWVKPAERYQDYDAVLQEERAKIAVVKADELRDAIFGVCGPSGWGQKYYFEMKVRQGELEIGFEIGKGEKREKSIGALYAGDPFTISLITSDILDFLDALGGAQSVSLAFKDGQSAIEMRPVGFDLNYQWRYLVMPRKSS